MTPSPDPAFLVAQDQLLGSDSLRSLAFASAPSVTEISSHTPGFLRRDLPKVFLQQLPPAPLTEVLILKYILH